MRETKMKEKTNWESIIKNQEENKTFGLLGFSRKTIKSIREKNKKEENKHEYKSNNRI